MGARLRKFGAQLFNILVRKPTPALPTSGDPVVDFMLEAGPRAFTPELASKEVRFAIAKTQSWGAYREALMHLAQNQVAIMHAQIRQVGRENRRIEHKATSSHIPHCRIPCLVWEFFESIYGEGCWKDNDFMEDFLKHHPECRIRVKRGIRGQEYLRPA
jgi:hypothetical protein